MRFEASAVTPGRAKRFQNGTDPSAKSSQSGVFPVNSEQFACSSCAGARPLPRRARAAAAATAAARTPSLFTGNTVARGTGVLTNVLRFRTRRTARWSVGPPRFPAAGAVAWVRAAEEDRARARRGGRRRNRRLGDRSGFREHTAGCAQSRTYVGGRSPDLCREVRGL